MFVFNFLHIFFSIFVDRIALFPCYLPFSRVLFALFIVNERNTKSTTWLHEFPIDFIVFQYISRNASGKKDDIRKCLSSEMIVFLFFLHYSACFWLGCPFDCVNPLLRKHLLTSRNNHPTSKFPADIYSVWTVFIIVFIYLSFVFSVQFLLHLPPSKILVNG